MENLQLPIVNEIKVTGRAERILIDKEAKLWQRISRWTHASDVEFGDGETLDTKFNNLKQSFQDGCKKIVDKLTALGHRPNDPQGPDEINTSIQDIYDKRYADGYSDGMNKTMSGNAKIKYKYHEHSSTCNPQTCTVTIRQTNVRDAWDGYGTSGILVADTYTIHSSCGVGTTIKTDHWSGSFERTSTHTYYTCGKATGQLEGAEIVFE